MVESSPSATVDATTTNPTKPKTLARSRISSIFSMTCGSTAFMSLFMITSVMNIYRMMYPLSAYDLLTFGDPANFIKPLWNTASEMHVRVYLSTKSQFDLRFFHSDVFPNTTIDDGTEATKNPLSRNHKLLWDEKLSSPAFSKSFLLTSCDGTPDTCRMDKSYLVATEILDQAERIAIERGEGGVLSALSAAGHGVESTSALLTIYQWFSDQISSSITFLVGKKDDNMKSIDPKTKHGILERNIINIPSASPMWKSLKSNSTLYLHVLLIKTDGENAIPWPPVSVDDASASVQTAIRTGSLLMGKVNMIKHEIPHHVDKPRRVLLNDVIYLYNKYVKYSREMPPWVYAISKPEEYDSYQKSLELKKRGASYPYWKPEVSIKYVNDDSEYPKELAGLSGLKAVSIKASKLHPSGFALLPTMHVDEMGLTREKYIPINETVTSLPLRITFDRNDLEDPTIRRSTATAGGMSPARWRLLSHLSESIEKQKEMGFEQSDIDEMKRLIADTNITLLAITFLASTLHLLFEFLTFKNEISFWNSNNDLTGLSVRSLFLDMIGQIIILLFLIEEQSSLLTTIPCAIGCLIALWKCHRGAGLKFVRIDREGRKSITWWNILPSLLGYELRATRLEARQNQTSSSENIAEIKKDKLIAMTLEADRIATRYLGAFLLPFVGGYTLYSFAYKEHSGWYSWIVTTAASAVYALGFVLMTPQLFLNWKLKSVAHLPWRVLVYKSLNTFIDDLFSFIIRMPTMARISCFRDDIVFFIYLYQRWLYPVDTSRPIEGGGDQTEMQKEIATADTDKKRKKNQ